MRIYGNCYGNWGFISATFCVYFCFFYISPAHFGFLDSMNSLKVLVQVNGLSYLPRQSAGNGVVEKYKLYTSTVYSGNSTVWTTQASGDWPFTGALKTAMFTGTQARYVKFTAVEGAGNFFTAAEISILFLSENCTNGIYPCSYRTTIMYCLGPIFSF